MKVVLLPGVRVYKPSPTHEKFLENITKKLHCDGEIFTWETGYNHPEYNLPLKSVRDLLYEIIMDFQEAITRAKEIRVTSGDIYIGHSAGSIIALVQQKPTITMASPAPLIDLVKRNRTGTNLKAIELADLILGNPAIPILNIINRYDVIACPFDKPNIENFEYTGNWMNLLSKFPPTAHSDYWTNTIVIDKIVDTIHKWSLKNVVK